MKRIFLIAALLLLITACWAQQLSEQEVRAKIDSIVSLVIKETDENKKIDKLLSIYTANIDAFPVLLFENYQKLYLAGVQKKDIIMESSAWSMAGQGYRLSGDYSKALECHYKAIALAEKNGNTALLGYAQNQMAHIYKDRQENETALNLYRQAALNTGQSTFQINWWAYMNMGAVFLNMGQLDSSLYYSLKAIKSFPPNSSETSLTYLTSNVGSVYSLKNELTLANEYFSQAKDLVEKSRSPRYSNSLYLSLAEHFYRHQQYDSCIYYARKAVDMVQHTFLNNLALKPARLLADIYRQKNADSALKYWNIYTAANDSLYSLRASQQLMMVSFEEQQRKRAIETEKINYQNKIRTNVMLAGLAIVLVIALILYRNNRQRKKANAVLEKALSDLKVTQSELEIKNHELEIEAALEKVRSRSLAMHKSDELHDVAYTLLDLAKQLEVETSYIDILTYVEGSKDIIGWIAGNDRHPTSQEVYHPYIDIRVFNDLVNAKEAGIDFFTQTYSLQEKNEFTDYMFTLPVAKEMPEETKTAFRQADGLTKSVALTKHAAVQLVRWYNKPFSDYENDILKRFSKVFEQAYIRFLDLQKAEAQAREAQIEMALEKVRSRTMAMQHSDELAEASFLLDSQVRALGIKTWGCAFNIYGNKESSEWFSSGQGSLPTYKTPRENLFLRYYEAGQAGETMLIEEFAGEACAAHYDYLCTIPIMGDALRGIKESGGSFPEQQIDHVTYFKYGYLLFITLEEAPEGHDIFIRFAKVFEQTYTRFLDLQKAEAQTREAQVEAALERVRSRTMAMQHSNELIDAATILFQQVEILGGASWNCGFNIWDEDRKYATAWNGSKDGIGQPFRTPSHEDVFLRFYEAAGRGESLYVEEMGGQDLEAHYRYLSTLPGVGEILKEFAEIGISLPTFQVFHIAYFSHGYLIFITYEPVPQLWDIFKRFATVFEQTYTRFLDLQKSESHARQAELDLVVIKEARQNAEAALAELQVTQKQLIQSEKMASLGELTAGIAHEIQNPLNFVNNFSEVSKELLDEMKVALESGDQEEAKAIAGDIIQNLEKINHHGKRADAIVKGMLQHSRTGTNQKEPTDINALADEYIRLCYHGLRAKDKSFNATITTDFDKLAGTINIIPQDIGRVILNLLTNAFYAVNEKKKLIANSQQLIADTYEPAVLVSTKKLSDKVEIYVTDNGDGIPQKILDKIFQPFFTTKPTGQGTGLGLSLSYDIITKGHNGKLNVETIPGERTTFLIQLPVEPV